MKKKQMNLTDFKAYCEAHNILRVIYSSESNQRINGLDLSLHFEKIVIGVVCKNICLRSEHPAQRAEPLTQWADTLMLTNVQEIILKTFGCWDVVTVTCRTYDDELCKHVLLIDYCIGTEPKTADD